MSTDVDLIAKSVLKTNPRVLFKHEGCETHHINRIGNHHMIARAGKNKTEIFVRDTGQIAARLPIEGLTCSLEVNGKVYCGTSYKELVCLSLSTFEILASIELKATANSIANGLREGTIIIGQNNGWLTTVLIDKEKAAG